MDLRLLRRLIAEPLVGRWEEAKLVVLALISGENAVLISRPGTGKTRLLKRAVEVLGARFFAYTLTPDTSPREILGRMAEADIVFLDEIFNARSETLNALLDILAEKVYSRGGEVIETRLWSCFAASNVTPRELGRRELEALYDRFTYRHFMEYVPLDDVTLVVRSWIRQEEGYTGSHIAGIGFDEIRGMRRRAVGAAKHVVDEYPHILRRVISSLREAGLLVTDRRIPKYVLAVAAHSLFRGAGKPGQLDFYVARYVFPEVDDDVKLVEEALSSALSVPSDYVTALLTRADNASELGEEELAELYAELVEARSLLPYKGVRAELDDAIERVKTTYRSKGYQKYLI